MTHRTLLLAQVRAVDPLIDRWNAFARLGNEWVQVANLGKIDARLWEKLRKKACDLFDLRPAEKK